MIRNAIFSDKDSIMTFCKDTFSWGDYIDQVWNFWLSEGNLFLFEKTIPVGICHAFYLNNQLWIEGIRIDPNFRRQKIASMLIEHAESIGRKKNIQFSLLPKDKDDVRNVIIEVRAGTGGDEAGLFAADLFANSHDSFKDLPFNKEKVKAPMKQSPEPTVSIALTECPST